MSTEPVVILYKSETCRFCTAVSNIWDTPPGKDKSSIVGVLKKINPKLRFFTVIAPDNSGKFNENVAPKDLIRYGAWFPMILLIPGKLWNSAMAKLGPKNDVILMDGVQILNGFWEKNNANKYILKNVSKYDIRNPEEFGRWLKDAMDNEDFKRVQNGTGPEASTPSVTNILQPTQPIQPLLPDVLRQGSSSSVIGKHEFDVSTDVCSMRIISYPS